MTSKTIKTVLFASLIATMILPFGMNTAFAETISDEIVEERNFSTNNHKTFQEYVDLPREDNAWNRVMIKENIKNYNIESKIGHDVDGYELLALDAQEQKLKNKYSPSIAELKIHEWASSKYDLPTDAKGIKDRIVEIAGQNHLGHSKQLADSLVTLAELGVVSPEIHKADPSFWNAVIYESYCNMNESCATADSEAPIFVMYQTNAPIMKIGYVSHIATIYVVYEYCETSGNTCTQYGTYNGSGYHNVDIGGPGHIGDQNLYTSLTNWSSAGDNVFVSAQVTAPLTGTMLYGIEHDGYISKNGNISHPNWYAWSYPTVTWKTYATS